MNDTKKKFLTQSIANINNIYDSLYNLSNDELREKSYRLQECIRKTKGDEVLDEKMERYTITNGQQGA